MDEGDCAALAHAAIVSEGEDRRLSRTVERKFLHSLGFGSKTSHGVAEVAEVATFGRDKVPALCKSAPILSSPANRPASKSMDTLSKKNSSKQHEQEEQISPYLTASMEADSLAEVQ